MKVIIICFIFLIHSIAISQVNEEKKIKTNLGGSIVYAKFERISRKSLFNLVDSNKRYSHKEFRGNCWNCQYLILDGDTIDYYDSKGFRQGDFVTFCSYYDKFGFGSCGLDEFCICKKCDFIEERMKFKNDTLVSKLKLGYIKNKIFDTLIYDIYDYKNQRVYTRFTNEKNGYYWVGFTDMKSNRQGLIKKYDLKTKKLIEEANYKDNEYSDSVIYYYDSGKIMARALYENDKKKVFHRFYRENGKRYAEVDVKDSKIVSKICFDTNGIKRIPCDSTKTLIGTPKTQLNLLPNGIIQIVK